MDIWKSILKKLKDKKKVMLLFVASHKGSSPGKQGFKMMVAEDGYLQGSIGGGRTEFKLVEKAKELLLKDTLSTSYLVNQVHRDDVENSSGMVCAGEQLVILYPITSSHKGVIQQIIDNKSGVLTISSDKFELDGGSALKDDFKFLYLNGDSWEYKENINRKPLLFIVGGGHVGIATARLFNTLDFDVTILDNRNSIDLPRENQFSDTINIINYKKVDDYIPEGKNTYVVVMTHGHKIDRLIFKKLIYKKYRYLGLLGSKAKISSLFNILEKDGVDRKLLENTDAPIGMAINSKTPSEIAVSIAAKIISVKNQKS